MEDIIVVPTEARARKVVATRSRRTKLLNSNDGENKSADLIGGAFSFVVCGLLRNSYLAYFFLQVPPRSS